jgi:hypothetical protein
VKALTISLVAGATLCGVVTTSYYGYGYPAYGYYRPLYYGGYYGPSYYGYYRRPYFGFYF